MDRRVILKELYDPTKAKKGEPNLDVVLIHGIDGDPVKTWQDKSGVVWPRDLLPQVQPRTRVLSFGYNADMYRNDSAAGIRDNARSLLSYLVIERQNVDPKRPIVFIAHCLGGFIVKQALYIARVNKSFKSVYGATRGLVFFGTPHYGTDKDRWRDMAKGYSVFDKTGWGWRSKLVEAMNRGSDALADVNAKFTQFADDFNVATFCEMKPCPGAKKPILEKADVEMESSYAKIYPIDANHVEMCWFSDPQSQDFKIMCKEILGEPLAAVRDIQNSHPSAATGSASTAVASLNVRSIAPQSGVVFDAGGIAIDYYTAASVFQMLGASRYGGGASGNSLPPARLTTGKQQALPWDQETAEFSRQRGPAAA